MKKFFLILYIAFFAINVFSKDVAIKRVFISKFVEHPALNMTQKGIIDGLCRHGYKDGVNLRLVIESAQANAVLASQIAAKFVGQGADVFVGIATISSQSFVKYTKQNKIKLVFSSVTDPLDANIVKNLHNPGNNTSGVSNFVDIEPQIKLFKQIQPSLKRLGFVYNPSEINSLSIIRKLNELCPKFDIMLVLQSANKTSEISQAIAKLVSDVDAIFISNDSTALSALSTIINIATKSMIPVYVSDTDAVELGALASLGPNQYNIGLQTANIIARALNDENLGDIPVEFPSQTELHINQYVAQKISIQFDENIKKSAIKIITEKKNDFK